MIVVKDLCKSFGDEEVLKNLNIRFDSDICCIMGPSGRGKSTLIKILMALIPPDKGVIEGNDVGFSAVFQEDRLLNHLDIFGNIRFVMGKYYEESPVRELIEELGLSDYAQKRIKDYSGGMKRRASIIRALIFSSDVLILDEPFSGLDYDNKTKAIDCILKRRENRSIIMVTHSREDADMMGAKIIEI